MPAAGRLREDLLEARARTRAVADDLGGERELGPRLAIVNPPRWELGHVGWFHEYWCLRRSAPGRHSPERGPSILQGADALYNSATVPHASRWTLPLPPFAETLAYRDAVLEHVMRTLERDVGEDEAYFAALATRHEDMHAEAFHYTRQTLAYPAPAIPHASPPAGEHLFGDALIAGGPFELGSVDDGRWAFDNEKWSHPVKLKAFRMSRTAVSNAEFLAFVEADGYRREEFWSEEGWRMLRAAPRRAPAGWRKGSGGWELRRFDRWLPLPPDEPVMHVSWHEAIAYCRHARRRLPTEAEWEYAATWDPARARKRRYPWGDGDWRPEVANLSGAAPASVHACPLGDSPLGLRQMIGNCWEWTSSVFLPYPGFVRDPYKEYSEPWFGTHRVLRGGAFTTSPRIAYATYRNFFTPERADIFAGFRTCALEDSMAVIRAKDNPKVRRWQALARDAAARRAAGRAIIEGPKLLEAWLQLRGAAASIFVTEACYEQGDYAGLLLGRFPTIVSAAVMAAVADVRTSQGIAAEVEIPSPAGPLADAPSCVFLEGIQDAGNVGTILRSACAFGIRDAVLGPGCADAWSPKVLRAGAGAHARLNLRNSNELSASLAEFAGRVLATVPRGGVPLHEADLDGRTGWIFGAEGRGVSRELSRHAHGSVTIPISGDTESLNVAAAAAVCFYEGARRRQ